MIAPFTPAEVPERVERARTHGIPVAEWLKDEISRLEGATHPFAIAYRNELQATLADEPRIQANLHPPDLHDR